MSALFDDLFIPDLATSAARGLRCLRDAVPDALNLVIHLNWWKPDDERGAHASGDWAYLICRAGFYYGARNDPAEWQGWDHKPVHRLTWLSLNDALTDDPRRGDVVAWAGSLTAQDRWKDLYRPHELWPDPDTWHPDYIESDRARPGYDDRMTAWRTVQDILTDAATRLEKTYA